MLFGANTRGESLKKTRKSTRLPTAVDNPQTAYHMVSIGDGWSVLFDCLELHVVSIGDGWSVLLGTSRGQYW